MSVSPRTRLTRINQITILCDLQDHEGLQAYRPQPVLRVPLAQCHQKVQASQLRLPTWNYWGQKERHLFQICVGVHIDKPAHWNWRWMSVWILFWLESRSDCNFRFADYKSQAVISIFKFTKIFFVKDIFVIAGHIWFKFHGHKRVLPNNRQCPTDSSDVRDPQWISGLWLNMEIS